MIRHGYGNATTDGSRRYFTAAALAADLGMTRRWVYLQVDEHGLPAFKVGRRLLFDPEAVDAWLNTHRIGDWPEPCQESPSPDFLG